MTDRPATPEPSLGPELWDVLARYVAGESPASEAEVVRRWLAEDPRRGELLGSLDRSIRSLAFTPPVDVDVEAALRRVTSRLNEPDIQPLPLRRAERVSDGWRSVGLRAAAVVALLLGATLVWRVTQTRTTPVVAARVYTTPVGRTDSVRFTDGSRAVLAPGTTLEVAAGYGGEIRSMELRGQALFDVVHDEKRPFTVGAGGALIEDLGTTFSVRSDDEDGVHVRVTSGSVLLQGRDDPKQGTAKPKPQTRKDEGVVLRAGERGTVGRDGRAMVERTTPAADDLAWTHGRLLFEDAPLSRVRSDIRRWYGVELQIADSSLANRHLTASFAGEPIEDVLNVIALALGARIERRGDTAVVRAK